MYPFLRYAVPIKKACAYSRIAIRRAEPAVRLIPRLGRKVLRKCVYAVGQLAPWLQLFGQRYYLAEILRQGVDYSNHGKLPGTESPYTGVIFTKNSLFLTLKIAVFTQNPRKSYSVVALPSLSSFERRPH
jgi:hypothetical protein